MTQIAERLKKLRCGIKKSQKQIAELLQTTQASINRYESGVAFPPPDTLLWYADFFDVSMDYIFGRTENPQGKLYDYSPKIVEDNKELKEFIEMCFDENSPVNAKLKQAMFKLLEEQGK